MYSNYMLTTIDNPFDPFDDFASWFRFDTEKGYNTCGLLHRIANVSDDLMQNEIDAAYEEAMDRIIMNDPFDIYKKIRKEITNSEQDT